MKKYELRNKNYLLRADLTAILEINHSRDENYLLGADLTGNLEINRLPQGDNFSLTLLYPLD